MKRILHFLLTPIIAVSLIIIKAYQEKISEFFSYPHASDVAIAILILGTIYSSYISVISPYKALENSRKKRWKELDDEAEKIIKTFRAKGYDLSFNIMTAHRKLFCKCEPQENDLTKTKVTLLPKIFKVIWSYGTHIVNSKLEFTTKQGCCGLAYTHEDFYSFDLGGLKASFSVSPGSVPASGQQEMVSESNLNQTLHKQFNFTDIQLELTDRVEMVASCPIVFTKTKPDARTYNVIGVLNVECRIPQSGILVSNPTERELIYNLMRSLSNLYSLRTDAYLPS